jgi:hypothetical protein
MRYGVLAGNEQINARIYELFGHLDPSDVERFVRKFRRQSDAQRFHTYRELILGGHLRREGWDLRYEQRVAGKTPDWVLLSGANRAIVEVVDVVTLHQRREVDVRISRTVSPGRAWAGWVTTPPDRIVSKIQQKVDSYAKLIGEVQLPFTVAVFGEFTAPIEVEEFAHAVHEFCGSVLVHNPSLAGVIFFRERYGEYQFSYLLNPHAHFPSALINALIRSAAA